MNKPNGRPQAHAVAVRADARMVGLLPPGSAVYELPAFARYIVFNEDPEHPPKCITWDGNIEPLDLNPVAS